MHRHDLVWIDPQATWTTLSPQAEPRLRAWMQARLPLVVARRDPAVDGAQLRLGVPLPLDEGRQRLSLRIEREAVIRHAPPPRLTEVIEALSAPWRPALQALQHRCAAQALSPRVFGSHAWQAITGRDYLHAGSDLDLLWQVDGPRQASQVCRLLQDWEALHGLRADGELVFDAAQAVNWREYAGEAAQVLVKGDAACWLAARSRLAGMELPA
ncbi:malonate decarboxylase holo-[acyl-carrier-protein] synthase [Stenotrophomonas sp. CFBP 13724]|uniref:malonate decarboxylase holo-[acyl-carrier-protein] synthase n=1 Tax=Stenotrophomonas sp. CFBP 13724 TaxID=2775298 RepID=UPI00177EAB24|nr:malonate decarboxylase holo-[acyl-carrier-protein] synthase [Stenotrophomonas sp. CFBP 13724]MBD8643267.1 malonate decarboxylase holo-[acyl-carrier-protein] synthase [Stenotrophomonas sp. CFBP 13724]